MGRRVGIFRTRDDEVVRVTFEGDKVVDKSEMLFAPQPVVLTMAGEAGDFEPVKHVGGTITIVSVGDDDCRDLMTSDILEVSVRVVNETTGEVLFAGYVSPHTYNQDVGGYVKEMSVEVVDWLGACKLLPYKTFSSGFSLLTINELVERINGLYFRAVKAIKWPATIHIIAAKEPPVAITGAELYSPRYFLAEVCDSAFFGNVNAYSQRIADGDERGEVLFPAESVTCYDVLAAIGNSFLLTLVQIGESWVWVDGVAIRESQEQSYYTATGDGGFALENVLDFGATNVLRADKALTISSVKKYSRVSIANGYEDSVQLLPAWGDENQLLLLGDVQMTTTGDIDNKKTYMWQRAKHLCYDTQSVKTTDGVTTGSEIVVYNESSSVYRKTPVLGVPFSGTASWQTKLVAYVPPAADDYTTILKQTAYTTALPQCAGIGLKINMSIAAAKGVCQLPTFDCDYIKDEWVNCLYMLIECGGKYYTASGSVDSQTGEVVYWVSYKVYNRVAFKASAGATSEWYFEDRRDANVLSYVYTDVVAVRDLRTGSRQTYETVGGSINIELCVKSGHDGKQTTLFIGDFGADVRLARDKYYLLQRLAANAGRYLRTGVGTAERSAHELPLNYMWQCSRGLLSTTVDGVDCATVERVDLFDGKFYVSNTCLGYTLGVNYGNRYGSSLERLAKLVNGGAAYSVEVAVDEAGGPAVSPLSRVAVAGVQGCVVSMERDVVNKKTTIVVL